MRKKQLEIMSKAIEKYLPRIIQCILDQEENVEYKSLVEILKAENKRLKAENENRLYIINQYVKAVEEILKC